jgi:SnoaL-like polyketide cyclase
MKGADDAYNARDYTFFMDKRHAPDVLVHQIGAPETHGLPPHRADMDLWIAGFPDMRVHNDPYDVQFGQGEWTVALGKLSGTFTQPLTLPDGTVVEPTGKAFTTFFTTIARWQDEQMVQEYVLFDAQDIMAQTGVGR